MVEAELIFRRCTLEYGGVDKETMNRRRRSVMGGRLALLEFQLKKAAADVVTELRQVGEGMARCGGVATWPFGDASEIRIGSHLADADPRAGTQAALLAARAYR